jgi:GTP-binding protein HflX
VKQTHYDIANPPAAERAVLVAHGRANGGPGLAESLAELGELARSAGARVLGELVQRRGPLHPATFIGKGKLGELTELVQERGADVAIFDDDLTPAQVRNLEKALGVKTVDRSELILDIFARRARTRESRLQVELAQLQYTLPRLTGMWKHLERQAGGIGTRGPGETQLESDRRRVRERIAHLKRQLEAVDRERRTQGKRRKREHRATLVGYTNAGKSTLFNALTRSGVDAHDRLFDTLDSVTRRLVSTSRRRVLLTDTVGFIRKLPHHLVASFRSTLMEVVEADVLLHVVDASHPAFRAQMEAVDEVLNDLLDSPGERWVVLNKADRLDEENRATLRLEFPGALLVSALTGEGLEELRRRLWEEPEAHRVPA